MNKKPPLYQHNATPQMLIQNHDMELLKAYLRTEVGNENKSFSPDSRAKIATMVERLLNYGFYIMGMGDDGDVRFSYALKSDSQALFESRLHEYEGKSRDELREMAVKGYMELV